MSQVIHPLWPVSARSLTVGGLALLLAVAEFAWTRHDSIHTAALWTQRIVVRQDTVKPGAHRTVQQKPDGSAGSFELSAGDDCLYVDNSAWSYQDPASNATLVPVFCPARGAGWAALDFLEGNRVSGR